MAINHKRTRNIYISTKASLSLDFCNRRNCLHFVFSFYKYKFWVRFEVFSLKVSYRNLHQPYLCADVPSLMHDHTINYIYNFIK